MQRSIHLRPLRAGIGGFGIGRSMDVNRPRNPWLKIVEQPDPSCGSIPTGWSARQVPQGRRSYSSH